MFFLKIDDYLLDCIFEPFAHKFQRLTGKTNFWLAKISWAVYTFVLLHLATGTGIVGYLVAPYLIFFLVMTSKILSAAEKEFLSEKSRYINSLRTRTFHSRIFGLMLFCPFFLFLSLSSENLEWFILGFAGVFGSYFTACTPLPPGTSKFRQWANKVLWKINDALNPRPEPMPTP